MFKYGDKLVMKPNTDIIEILGVSNAGQVIRYESNERQYLVMLCGHHIYLKESLLSELCKKYEIDPVEQIIEQIVPPAIVAEKETPELKKPVAKRGRPKK